jgi:hypothetical protein
VLTPDPTVHRMLAQERTASLRAAARPKRSRDGANSGRQAATHERAPDCVGLAPSPALRSG